MITEYIWRRNTAYTVEALPGKKPQTLEQGITDVLDEMSEFFKGDAKAEADIGYQINKLKIKDMRYAHQVRWDYKDHYIEDGLRRAAL